MARSLYSLALETVLSKRTDMHKELAALPRRITADPLDGAHAAVWANHAATNPALLDWLVLSTDYTITKMTKMIFPRALEAGCVEVLDWFVKQLTKEIPDDPLSSLPPLQTKLHDIFTQTVIRGGEEVIRIDAKYLLAKWAVLQKDHLPAARWMLQHGIVSAKVMWMKVLHDYDAPKIKAWMINEPAFKMMWMKVLHGHDAPEIKAWIINELAFKMLDTGHPRS
jgi:hypothetical protein